MKSLIKAYKLLLIGMLLIPQSVSAQCVQTAIGCVPVNPNEFVNRMITYIAGFSGGIALLLMAKGAITMITSGGDPDAIKSGREQLVAAFIGLLFVLLSVTLLQIIGVDILALPGISR